MQKAIFQYSTCCVEFIWSLFLIFDKQESIAAYLASWDPIFAYTCTAADFSQGMKQQMLCFWDQNQTHKINLSKKLRYFEFSLKDNLSQDYLHKNWEMAPLLLAASYLY